MNPDLWGGLVLLAMLGGILWGAAGLPVPRAVRHLLSGGDEDAKKNGFRPPPER